MYPVLHRTGFANQPTAKHRDDGLVLTDAYITAAVRCAPPQNKPTAAEIVNCSKFLDAELDCLKNVRVVVALGRIGFDAYLNYMKRKGQLTNKSAYKFGHGASYDLPDGRILLASYHPSNQNTQTGRLTEPMLERFIGVIYRPETERWSHYSQANLPNQFDGWVWFDETEAVSPLPGEARPGDQVSADETWPFGL
jgi:uracil-DNA glycosylase